MASADQILRIGATLLLGGSAIAGVVSYYKDNEDHEEHRRSRRRAASSESASSSSSSTPMLAATTLLRGLRALTLPCATIACAWSLVKNPAPLINTVPPLFRRSSYAAAAVSTSDAVPINVPDRLTAFKLGCLQGTVHSLSNNPVLDPQKQAKINAALKECAKLVGRDSVTIEQLGQVAKTCRDLDNARGPFQRLVGLLSFANILRTVATVGITATVVPFVGVVAGPWLLSVATRFVEHVVVPTALFCHETGIAEVAAYALTALVTIESARYPLSDSLSYAGVGTAVTSVCMFFGAWLYTTSRISDGGGNVHLWTGMTAAMMGCFCAPLAVLHQSKFLGTLTVCAAVITAGFSAFSTGLCLFIGFDSRATLQRCVAACGLIGAAHGLARATYADSSRFLAPFSSASTISSSVLLLGLMILAETEKKQPQFLATCGMMTLVGEVLGMPGTRNAALVWASLWAFGNGCYYVTAAGNVAGAFASFVALFFVSRYIQRNPHLLMQAIFGQ